MGSCVRFAQQYMANKLQYMRSVPDKSSTLLTFEHAQQLGSCVLFVKQYGFVRLVRAAVRVAHTYYCINPVHSWPLRDCIRRCGWVRASCSCSSIHCVHISLQKPSTQLTFVGNYIRRCGRVRVSCSCSSAFRVYILLCKPSTQLTFVRNCIRRCGRVRASCSCSSTRRVYILLFTPSTQLTMGWLRLAGSLEL